MKILCFKARHFYAKILDPVLNGPEEAIVSLESHMVGECSYLQNGCTLRFQESNHTVSGLQHDYSGGGGGGNHSSSSSP